MSSQPLASATPWKWSPDHGDYYCYLYNQHTGRYDILKWGRNETKVPEYQPPSNSGPLSTTPLPSSHNGQSQLQTTAHQTLYAAGNYNTHTPTHTSAHSTTHSSGTYDSGYATQSGSRGYSTAQPAATSAYINHATSSHAYTAAQGVVWEVVRSPSNFFRVGRMFMAKDPTSQRRRNFVVIHKLQGRNACECLAYDDYDGLGTSKSGVDASTHAPLVVNGTRDVQIHPNEAPLQKVALYVILENDDYILPSMSRLDLRRKFIIDYGTTVCKIGRIDPGSIKDLEDMLDEF